MVMPGGRRPLGITSLQFPERGRSARASNPITGRVARRYADRFPPPNCATSRSSRSRSSSATANPIVVVLILDRTRIAFTDAIYYCLRGLRCVDKLRAVIACLAQKLVSAGMIRRPAAPVRVRRSR